MAIALRPEIEHYATVRGTDTHDAMCDAMLEYGGLAYLEGSWFSVLYATSEPADVFLWRVRALPETAIGQA